jgi:hypothetical protein
VSRRAAPPVMNSFAFIIASSSAVQLCQNMLGSREHITAMFYSPLRRLVLRPPEGAVCRIFKATAASMPSGIT